MDRGRKTEIYWAVSIASFHVWQSDVWYWPCNNLASCVEIWFFEKISGSAWFNARPAKAKVRVLLFHQALCLVEGVSLTCLGPTWALFLSASLICLDGVGWLLPIIHSLGLPRALHSLVSPSFLLCPPPSGFQLPARSFHGFYGTHFWNKEVT